MNPLVSLLVSLLMVGQLARLLVGCLVSPSVDFLEKCGKLHFHAPAPEHFFPFSTWMLGEKRFPGRSFPENMLINVSDLL